MVKLIRRLVNRAPRTVEDALRELLPRPLFQQVSSTTPDRRELLERCAEQHGVDTAALLAQVAEVLELQVVLAPPPLADGAALPNGLSLHALQQLAATVVLHEGVVIAFVAVDPHQLRTALAIPAQIPVYLGSWSAVQRALTASAPQENAPSEAPRASSPDALARRALQLIADEVQRHGVFRFSLSLDAPPYLYRFLTMDGREGLGELGTAAVPALRGFLAQRTEVELQGSDGAVQRYEVRRLSDESPFKLELHYNRSTEEPLATQQQPAAADTQETPQVEPQLGEMGQVLLVDDSDVFLRVVERFFSRAELSTTRTNSAQEALEIFQRSHHSISLVISDVHMPGMNGVEFVTALRKISKDVPVIMLTSDSDVEMHLKMVAVGADAYLTKDSDPRLLLSYARKLGTKGERRAA